MGHPTGRVEVLEKELQATKKELEGLQRTFQLRWDADMRATRRWRKGHPKRELVLPDHADLCVWLLEQLEAAPKRTGKVVTYYEVYFRDGKDWCSIPDSDRCLSLEDATTLASDMGEKFNLETKVKTIRRYIPDGSEPTHPALRDRAACPRCLADSIARGLPPTRVAMEKTRLPQRPQGQTVTRLSGLRWLWVCPTCDFSGTDSEVKTLLEAIAKAL